uniref:C2H2-type domain-containing protein n=1 Tax=Ascaris lumbricoides TaxID=6252 RepID=A0A0M3HK90_ASCLU
MIEKVAIMMLNKCPCPMTSCSKENLQDKLALSHVRTQHAVFHVLLPIEGWCRPSAR